MSEFAVAYKNWLDGRKWAEQKELTGEQRIMLAKLDHVKRMIWNSMGQEARRKIVNELVGLGYLPPEVPQLMDIFDARVIKV